MNENIIKLNYLDKEIYLVKTAHVSKASVEDVKACIDEVNPDTICVELDKDRLKSFEDKDAWRNQDIVKVIKGKQVGYLMVTIILSSFQKRMAKSMDSNSGAEMIEGIKQAREKNLELVLADRPVKTTFSRIWSKLGLKEKAKLLGSIIESVFDKEEISEDELASLKESDALEAALNEVGKEFPTVKEVLVDERDAYLATKIKQAKGNKIVAIIGAAHANGIQRNIDKTFNIKEFEVIEKEKKSTGLVKWLIPIIIILMIVVTFVLNKDVGIEQIKSWILWNGTFSAIGALLALGHPLTILTAFIAAPITSLNPLLSSGFFAGIVEATVRKPKVKDFEDIASDTATFKGFFKNRVTRILLVVLLSGVFSGIATFISGIDIATSFAKVFSEIFH